ncbi:MAG: hypothetical protein C0412_13200 [Flavobacterium sp.]|nr:hypothetical protein [Flavobacterium sp.]
MDDFVKLTIERKKSRNFIRFHFANHILGNSVDTITLENLLNESESNYLDFKQDQYRFEGASEEDKSELLKDILAFANAWRRTDAYIIIGVQEVKGGRSQVVGITNHFDDASLQQFINNKVQKPIQFSYTTFEFEGKQVGILQIPVQERPFYVKQKYGKVKQNIVYLRRGSSTDESEPDEIAKMGVALIDNTQLQIPIVDCEFANPITRTLYGKEIKVTSNLLKVNEPIPVFSARKSALTIDTIGSSPNRNFYRELYQFYAYQSLLKKVSIRLKNTGSVTAYNARVEIQTEVDELLFIKRRDFPEHPQKYYNYLASISERAYVPAIAQIGSRLLIDKNGAGWLISINFGNIQPKAEDWLEEPIFIGSKINQDVHFDAVIYADNASNPIHVPLCIHFRTDEVVRTLKDLESQHGKNIEKEFNKLYPDE